MPRDAKHKSTTKRIDLDTLVGKTVEEAEIALGGRNWRFVGPTIFGTADCKPGRINVHLDKRGKKVARVTVE